MQIPPKVTIIILHLNDIPCLVDCIKSLNKITYQNFDIIIVHNGLETARLRDVLIPVYEHITKIIYTGANLGFAAGNNIGIRQALHGGADYILLLNDDTEVDPDFLTKMIEVAEIRPNVGMLGPKIYNYNEPDKVWFAGARFDRNACMVTMTEFDQTYKCEDNDFAESDYVTGCALLIKKEALEKIGLLDERFFLYWEDVDWGLRCMKAGFKNLIVTHSHIWHKASASSGGINSLMRAYHKTRGQLLIARLYKAKILWKLQRKFFRDIAWVLFKSSDPHRIKKAKAFLVAMIDYHTGETGKGPDWLVTK